MRLKRTTEEHGSGSGLNRFRSDYFDVIEWHWQKGEISTVLECKLLEYPNNKIQFVGKVPFKSNVKCMEQFTCKEILQMMKNQRNKGIKEGKNLKIRELKKCLEGEY